MLKDQTRPPHVPASCKPWGAGERWVQERPCNLKGQMKGHHVQTSRSWDRQDCWGNGHLEGSLLREWWESKECSASGESPFSDRKVFPGKFRGSCNSSNDVIFWYNFILRYMNKKMILYWFWSWGWKLRKRLRNFPKRMHFCSDCAYLSTKISY